MKHDAAAWEVVHPELNLYRYRDEAGRPAQPCKPILLLHGTLGSRHSWNDLAQQLWSAGIEPIYALDSPGLQMGNSLSEAITSLEEAVKFLVEAQYPGEDIVLIGHAAGGIAAYHYWLERGQNARLAYLFMLAAPHSRTVFTGLRENFVQGSSDDERRHSDTFRNFSRIESAYPQASTVLVNIFGDAEGPDFDGVTRGLRLPDAVNVALPLDHKSLNKGRRVAELILSYLRGDFFQVKLKLVGLCMRREDSSGLSGPIAFEVDRSRVPPDSIFQAVTTRLYVLEERVPPVCTLAYAASARSATITLQLRDLSNVPGRRRRMYTSLHIPLQENETSILTMQDSEGSDFLWRISCQRMPVMLGEPRPQPEMPNLGRGI